MTDKFPDVDWYCVNGSAYPNNQDRLDNPKYLWKCTECGFKISISKDNIGFGDDKDISGLGVQEAEISACT